MTLDRTAWTTITGVLGGAVLLAVLNLAVPATSGAHVPTYAVALAGKYLCYAMLALALDLVWGLAGILSGLLGIGSGALKVIAMDHAMQIPFKVSTTTSNFMIGVTAAASAGIYLSRGYVDPGLAMPVMLGVLAGSLTGARVLTTARTQTLRLAFGAVVAVLGIEMIYNSAMGRL